MAVRERRELEDLHARVKTAHEHSPYGQEYAELDFIEALVAEAISRANAVLPDSVVLELKEFVFALTQEDPVVFWMPELPGELTIEASISLRALLAAKERFLSDPARYENIWREKIIRLFEGFLGRLPALPEGGQFSVSVTDVCNVPILVEREAHHDRPL
ncbi:MAG TPA: hypothetical protein VNF99_10595 [Stellaceae bacterium]|nr:hypothetical protein [Stellaceae bacterium]